MSFALLAPQDGGKWTWINHGLNPFWYCYVVAKKLYCSGKSIIEMLLHVDFIIKILQLIMDFSLVDWRPCTKKEIMLLLVYQYFSSSICGYYISLMRNRKKRKKQKESVTGQYLHSIALHHKCSFQIHLFPYTHQTFYHQQQQQRALGSQPAQ